MKFRPFEAGSNTEAPGSTTRTSQRSGLSVVEQDISAENRTSTQRVSLAGRVYRREGAWQIHKCGRTCGEGQGLRLDGAADGSSA
jgi:hypothetical protein